MNARGCGKMYSGGSRGKMSSWRGTLKGRKDLCIYTMFWVRFVKGAAV